MRLDECRTDVDVTAPHEMPLPQNYQVSVVVTLYLSPMVLFLCLNAIFFYDCIAGDIPNNIGCPPMSPSANVTKCVGLLIVWILGFRMTRSLMGVTPLVLRACLAPRLRS